MAKTRWSLALAVILSASALCGTSSISAQGVTTGAISGTITDASGAPVDNAQIQVTNRSNGARVGGLSRSTGVYTIVGLDVGGPYSILVRRIGFQPEQRDGIAVSLGQTVKADFKLQPQAATLSTVAVTVSQNPVMSTTKTGVSTTVSDSALRRLPSLNRNFTDFVTLVPQAATAYTGPTSTPGVSAGGVNNRYNNIQIDGANETDIFGLGTTGQPGGQANGKSIGVESVKEYQVLLSPFDLRQGNFAGAQINAVTKSGTERFPRLGLHLWLQPGLRPRRSGHPHRALHAETIRLLSGRPDSQGSRLLLRQSRVADTVIAGRGPLPGRAGLRADRGHCPDRFDQSLPQHPEEPVQHQRRLGGAVQ